MILRTCNADFTSKWNSSFKWPNTIGSVVEPETWNPDPICGYGLHGFLHGEGDYSLADMTDTAQWIVFSGDIIVDIDGNKVKTNKATILHIGQGETAFERRQDCHNFMRKARMLGNRAFYSTNTGGDSSTNTGGNSSTNTGGDGSTNTGGNSSTNTGGYSSTNTGGDYSMNTGGDSSTNTGGNYSTNTGGDYSTNTGGNSSTFLTGENSSFTGQWFDGNRMRRKTFYSGEDYKVGIRYVFTNGNISEV